MAKYSLAKLAMRPDFCRLITKNVAMKLVIFGNNYQDANITAIVRLIAQLRERGVAVSLEREFHDYLQSQTTGLCALHTVSAGAAIDADVALSLGGDGTFLTTVMWVVEQGVPIMGINMGHLGYLAAYSLDEAPQAIDDLLAGHYVIEHRAMLMAQCEGVDIEHPLALNDIAILRQDTSSMIEMETTLQGRPLTTYKGDGLVVCTPTGSTAYNLSAGGPILEPNTRCMVLSPISPHSLTMRPLVVPDEAVITIVTHTRADSYRLSLDGEGITCPAGSRVTIRRAPVEVKVIQRTGHNFAQTLRHKLHWGS